jgi:hypothetical protein
MDPYLSNDCFFGDNIFPHVQNQCECVNEIRIIPADVSLRYTEYRSSTLFRQIYGTTMDRVAITSCDARNQAWIFLASGRNLTVGDTVQRSILASLYVLLQGTKWKRRARWMSDAPECTWEGVACDESSQITRLTLSDNAAS